jgi:AcrR family transcriptional regulator
VSTDVVRDDSRRTPLAAVAEALERAVAQSELTRSQLEWSMARLGHRGEHGAAPGADGRRPEILRAGTRVFLRRGYLNATVEDVAREVSLTKPAIYHYFRSKESLLDAILESSLIAVETAVATSARGSGTATERLRVALLRCVELVLDDEGTRVLLQNLDAVTGAAGPSSARRARRIRTRLENVLEEGQLRREFAPVDPALAVFALIGALNWLSGWYEPGGPQTRAHVRDTLVEQLLEGILAR